MEFENCLKNMNSELSVFEKTYELILWLYPTVNKFPKSQRFVLGQRIETAALGILEKIIMAKQSTAKTVYLKKASAELDVLRILIRLSKDLHFISIRQYEFAASKINETGKMLGGWIKFCGAGQGR